MTLLADDLFSAMANDIRLRCMMLLQREGELCVCELTQALDLSQPMISRHLALLREAELVRVRRAGVWIFYSLNQKLPGWVRTVLESTAEGVKNQEPYRRDRRALKKMPKQAPASCCS